MEFPSALFIAGKYIASRIRRRLLDAGGSASVATKRFFFAHKMDSGNIRARCFDRVVPRHNLFTCVLYRLDMEAKPAGAVFGRAVGGNSHRAINTDLLILSRSPFDKLRGTDAQQHTASTHQLLRAGHA